MESKSECTDEAANIAACLWKFCAEELSKWRDAFYAAGFGDEIGWLASKIFKPLPERAD